MTSTPPEIRTGGFGPIASEMRHARAASRRQVSAARDGKPVIVLPEMTSATAHGAARAKAAPVPRGHGLSLMAPDCRRRSCGEYPYIKDFCYKVKWQFWGKKGATRAPRAQLSRRRRTPGPAKPPSPRLRKSHIFAAVAPVPTDRAGSGRAARVGRSYPEYPLIKDCCYKPKVFCMLICKPNIYIL
jgi:hypothetical protein